MKPIIGMNVDIAIDDPNKASILLAYPDAIVAAGGVPLLLAPAMVKDIPMLLQRIDGLMLIGGDDYNPEYYGQQTAAQTRVGVKQRQEFDLALAQIAVNQTALPILGICAGCQLLNIALGGTLIQDIAVHAPESCVKHGNENGEYGKHEVVLKSGTRLQKIYGESSISTPTWHHQAILTPGKDLQVAALASDGIVEAVELAGERFRIGVQWHPEQDLEGHKALFRAFVNAARGSTAAPVENSIKGSSSMYQVCNAAFDALYRR